MQKTYRFTLPQNKEVDCTMVRVENGQVVVDVEFKEKFEPKDGDFLVLKNSIFIYKANGGTITLNGYYVGVNYDGEIVINDRLNSGFGLRGEKMRFATPEEKAAFLERLEKECGKRWNAEKKCLEDIRWRAEKGESYYYISTSLGVDISKDNDVRGDFSEMRYKSNNYFRTHKAAQKVADQIKEIFKNSKAE